MGIITLDRPVEIETRSGWQFSLDFWTGEPPTAVIDDLTGYSSALALTPQSMPDALPIMLTSDAGDISIAGGNVLVTVSRGQNAYWPEDHYDLLWRVYRNTDPADRYVVRSHPTRSPVRVRVPEGGLTPIPGVGNDIVLPLSFSNGYAPNEVLTGYPVVDTVILSDGGSKFQSLDKPTGVVVFGIRANGSLIGTATMDPASCGPGPIFNGVVALNSSPVTLAPFFLDWVAPATVDATFRSAGLTLAG